MSRVYRLPDDMNEKEKAVGGILTFAQTGWIGRGGIVAMAIFLALAKKIGVVIAIVIGLIPGLAIAIPFAFYKKGGLSFASYLAWRIKFARKDKYLINTYTYRADRPDLFEEEDMLN